MRRVRLVWGAHRVQPTSAQFSGACLVGPPQAVAPQAVSAMSWAACSVVRAVARLDRVAVLPTCLVAF